MNNSLPRLMEGMIATLRKEVIPRLDDDYARGQAYGVVYMLNSLKLRASWSNAFLGEQLGALDEAQRALAALSPELPGAPLPQAQRTEPLPQTADLEAARDAGDRALCDFIDWLAANRDKVPAEAGARADAVVDAYLTRQLRFEISTSAKPMFVEMSGGAEKTK